MTNYDVNNDGYISLDEFYSRNWYENRLEKVGEEIWQAVGSDVGADKDAIRTEIYDVRGGITWLPSEIWDPIFNWVEQWISEYDFCV